MKKAHIIAISIGITLVLSFFVLLTVAAVNVYNKTEQSNKQLLTQEQLDLAKQNRFDVNYLYIGAIVGGLIGGYFLYKNDQKNKDKGQQLNLYSKPSRRD